MHKDHLVDVGLQVFLDAHNTIPQKSLQRNLSCHGVRKIIILGFNYLKKNPTTDPTTKGK